MKRIQYAALAILLIGGLLPAAEAADISARSAVVMDADSGRILYAHNENEKRLIASTTKLMTALVALESGHALDEIVHIAPEWAGVEGSSIYLQTGEDVTLEALLYGMLLRSGNDAATAVAGYCGGTVENFVAKMNRKAEQLSMHDSHFENPSGLDGERHYSTARDMAMLARACLNNTQLSEIVKTRSITLGTRYFTNHNRLLWRYEGCVGLKTGYTEKAGRTLVSAAKRGDTTLICVTLSAPDDWSDHTKLLDACFAQYSTREFIRAGERVCRLPTAQSLLPFGPLIAKDTVRVAVSDGDTLERRLRLNYEVLTAPISKGAVVGSVEWYQNGELLAETTLITEIELPRNLFNKNTLFARWKGFRPEERREENRGRATAKTDFGLRSGLPPRG